MNEIPQPYPSPPLPVTGPDIVATMRQLIDQAFAHSRKSRITNSIRLSIPIKERPQLTWLAQQTTEEKIYFSTREKGFTVAGIGSADCRQSDTPQEITFIFDECQKRLNPAYPSLRYYGGLCFDSSNIDIEWDNFGIYTFILPRFELMADTNGYQFACNLLPQDFNQDSYLHITRILEQLVFEKTFQPERTFLPQFRVDFPDWSQWNNAVKKILKLIFDQQVQKVVLARKTVFHFKEILNPFILLTQIQTITPNCFHFYFQTKNGTAFIGASPERLYRRRGKRIMTEALAGTRPRGITEQSDDEFARELFSSIKERNEHQYVITMIRGILQRYCCQFSCDDRLSLLKLENGQHLLTPFSGDLKAGVSDAELLTAFHPTPAVGGVPSKAAIQLIRSLEPFKRGWYTGPVGYLGTDSCEFAVAIRCGLVRHNQLSLFTGAGIVEGSDPETEWDEVENKLKIYYRAFTL